MVGVSVPGALGEGTSTSGSKAGSSAGASLGCPGGSGDGVEGSGGAAG